jgi:hypothetical protein
MSCEFSVIIYLILGLMYLLIESIVILIDITRNIMDAVLIIQNVFLFVVN